MHTGHARTLHLCFVALQGERSGLARRDESRLRPSFLSPFLRCCREISILCFGISVLQRLSIYWAGAQVNLDVLTIRACGVSSCSRDAMPGFGRVGSLLRSIEDEMSDMMNRVGMSAPTALAPSEVVCVTRRSLLSVYLLSMRSCWILRPILCVPTHDGIERCYFSFQHLAFNDVLIDFVAGVL